MFTVRTVTAKPSWGWTAARSLAELAGFAALFFITRFLARGHLVPQMDQECHIGGIAIDVLAHGIRFPLLVYAPNEYDNGSFFSGLLAALAFSLLGRSVLALKLVTHVIVAAGAVATLHLLRACLAELGLSSRRARWAATTALLVALAMAPRVVTLFSTFAVGNHAEGVAIDTLLLALFSRRLKTRSATGTAAYWALVGFMLYLNKGTALVVPVLGAAEVALAWRSPLRRASARLAAAFGGFALGALPELLVVVQQRAVDGATLGWLTIASKGGRNVNAFPGAFVDTLLFLGEYRIELLAWWALAICAGVVLLVRHELHRRGYGRSAEPLHGSASSRAVAAPAVTLGIVVGVTLLHLTALTVMAKSGLDEYVIYGYPTLVVLFSVLVAWLCTWTAKRWGEGPGAWLAMALIAMTLLVYRPDALTWGSARVSALWRNRTGAACSWRFAEGFEREHEYALTPPGQTREQYAIQRCRSLSEHAQILDCVGGIARELNWRQHGKVDGEPPAGLSPEERRAYAYHYGTHRKGQVTPCADFKSSELSAICAAAVQTECLHFADIYTNLVSGQGLGAPRCTVDPPPMDGYWAEIRLDLLTRPAGTGPNLVRAWGDDDLRACKPVLDACY